MAHDTSLNRSTTITFHNLSRDLYRPRNRIKRLFTKERLQCLPKKVGCDHNQ